MNWREPTYDEPDLVWSVPEDSPKPEGAEISEKDFDAIREELDDDK